MESLNDMNKKLKLDIEPQNEDAKICKHFVKRKKRFCKMTVAKGKDYCGEHDPIVNNIDDEENRIVCPLDPKHTIYKKNLRKHLKICNSRPKKDIPPYIQKGINDGSSDEEHIDKDEVITQLKLSDVSEEYLINLIKKVEQIYEKYIGEKIEELIFKHDILSEELGETGYGHETIKHLAQTASILGYLEKLEFLKNETSFIEFGAGKGQLSYWLAKLIETRPNYFPTTNVILIDRASLRHKKDNKLEDRSSVHRIRADISDFVLHELDCLQNMKNLVAIGKHLCGGATDLMLRCLLQNNTSSDKDISFLVALCCHHRCEWKSFVGKVFFKENNLNRKDFGLITKMVSWAICGTGMSRERRKQLEENGEMEKVIKEQIKVNVKLSRENREKIGKMCKRVLDYARLKFMESQGYDCELKFYVKTDITLENVCMIGKKRKSTVNGLIKE